MSRYRNATLARFGPAAFGPESDLAVNDHAVFGASIGVTGRS